MTSLVRRAASYELGLWRSLFRWLLRRPLVHRPGAETFGYASPVTPVLAAFTGLSAMEILVVELLLPWESARRVALALGVYGLFWMLGLLASLRVHPHILDDAGIRIRYGIAVDIAIPWEAIGEIRASRRSLPSGRSGKPRLEPSPSGPSFSIPITSTTNVDIALLGPTAVRLPRNRSETITELRVYADDPRAFVARARERRKATEADRHATVA